MAIAFISLGSNLGNRAQYLSDARDAIRQNIGEIIAESSIFENEAIGFQGNSFYNQVIKINTALLPVILLQSAEEIEKKMGRIKKTTPKDDIPAYTNRTIDIDILLYDDLQIDTEKLTIPHKKMYEREFVMKLLSELTINH